MPSRAIAVGALALAVGAAILVLVLDDGSGARSDAQVIREWSDTLRRGDVAGAARLFAIPSEVANGTPPVRLATEAQARSFNESLPCGARLLGTRREKGYTVARFRLTERPGGDCGAGVGDTASTAFRVRDGRIVEWLRVPEDGSSEPPVPGSATS